MPTPERKTSQTAWSRRQRQQQHNSPFSRARPVTLNLDASISPGPTDESPARYRRKFSQTGTFGDAFEYVLRDDEEDSFNLQPTRRPSLRTRRTSSAMSLHSDPPELEEAYRQIDDANSLTDFDPSDDENAIFRSNPDKLNRRVPTTSARKEHRLSSASNASFASQSPRRRVIDPIRDEERLKRATTSRSPVLDRSMLATGPLSEHLQRREAENQSVSEEDKFGLEPSMNLPSTWGSKGNPRPSWMDSLKRNRIGTPTDAGETPSRLSDKSSVKVSEERAAQKKTNRSRPASSHYARPSPPHAPTSPKHPEEYPSGGQHIPNTPIFTFPSSTFTKRSPSKRDSHELLRKLARTESPNQTPEPTTTARRVYDKTPVAPGAWIDTPMTQRAPTSQPKDDIITLQSSPTKIWGQRKLVERAIHEDNAEVDQGELLPNFEPLKRQWEKVEEPPKETPNKDTPTEKSIAEEEKRSDEYSGSESNPPTRDLESKPQEKPPITLPDHPKSALETVLEDHKSNKESLDVGDDTIESLQAILDQQPSDDPKAEEQDDTAYEQQVLGQLESASSSDMKDVERIEGKLQSLADTMAHLKTGLNQLGNRVSRDTEYIIASLGNPPKQTEPKQPQLPRSCECASNCGMVQSNIPIPRLWKQGNAWWKLRPTLLGWCALIPLMWYLSESTMCDYYCHPFVSSNCEGNCLDPDAPRFPFVIPTLIWRWFHLSDLLIPLWTLLGAFFRFFTQLLGFSDGYVDDEPQSLNLSGKLWIGGTPIESATAAATSSSGGIIPPLSQWTWKQETHVPDSVPEVDLNGVPDDPWADVSMDEDEFL